MQETWVSSLVQEDSLEKEMATHSSILAGRACDQRSLAGLQSVLCCAQLISCFWHFSTPWTAAARLLCPWDSPGKNTGVGCHALLQGIFLTQSSNPGILHCRWILYHLYHLSYQQSPGYSLWGRNRVGGDLVTKQQQQQSVHIYDLFLVPALV